MRRLVIAGRTCGVGRTTTAVNLAITAAQAGRRVLLVDAEADHAVVSALNLDPDAGRKDDSPLPSSRIWREAAADVDVVATSHRAAVSELLQQLQANPISSQYHLAIIDAPLGTPVHDADVLVWVVRGDLVSARKVHAEFAKSGANGQANVLFMIPPRSTVTEADLQATVGSSVRIAVLPFDPAVGRSLLFGQPVAIADPNAPVSVALRQLAAHLGLVIEPATPDWHTAEPLAVPDHIVKSAGVSVAEMPAPLPSAFVAATNVPESRVESYAPPPLPATEWVRPAESDFVDLPRPPVDEPPSGIVAKAETVLSPSTVQIPGNVAETPVVGQELGFHVEYDAIADGSAWTAPTTELVEVPAVGFAGASTEGLVGPAVPPPLEVPFGVVGEESGTAHRALNQSSMSFVAHGVELNAPKAAIHGQSCKEEESARFWGPTQEQSKAATLAKDGHSGDISGVVYSPDGRQVLTASWDKTVRVWWARDGKLITALKGHTGVVSALAFGPSGDTLITGSWDKTVRLWDAITLTERRCLSGHTGVVIAVAASVDGRTFASGGWDKTVRIWHADNDHGKVLTGHQRMVTGVAFAPDGKQLASASWDKNIHIWDTATGELIRTLSGHTGDITGLVWLSAGRIASIAQDHIGIIWNVPDGAILHQLEGHCGELNAIASTRDHKLVATAGWDKSIRLWDVETGSCVATLMGHGGIVSGLAFDPNCQRLVSVSHDRSMRIWDIASQRESANFAIQSGATTNEVLLPDVVATSDTATQATEIVAEPQQAAGSFEADTPPPLRRVDTPIVADAESIFTADRSADELPPPSGIVGAAPPRPLPVKVPDLRKGGTLNALAVAGGSGIVAAGAVDGIVLLWDLATGADAGVLEGHVGPVAALAFAPGGRVLASGGEDTVIRLWDVASARERLKLHGHQAAITALVINPDGNILISGDANGTIKLWDLAAGTELHSFQQPGGTLCLAVASDGERLAAGGRDGSIRAWNIATLQELATMAASGGNVQTLAFTADGRTLASGSIDGTVRFWEVASWKEWNSLEAHEAAVTAVAFSPNGQLLATGSRDTTARIWDCLTGQLLHELIGHSEPVVAAAFAADNFTLCTASQDQTVRSWYTDTGKPHGLLCQTTDSVTGDGTGIDFGIPAEPSEIFNFRWRLAAGSSDSRIRLWDFGDNHRIAEHASALLEGHSLDVNALAFNPEGTLLASASGDKTVRLWHIRDGRLLAKLEGHTGDVSSVAFSPDGALLASGSWDTMIRLWDVATKKDTGGLRGHVGAVTSIAFHPAGRMLASAGWDKNVLLWDLAAKKSYGALSGHEKMVTSVVFSPDGKLIATGGWDKTARLWNSDSGRCLRTMTGHRFAVSAVAMHPSGKVLATGSWDTSVKLWNLDNGEEIRTLYGHNDSVRTVAFMPDGSLVAAGSWDGTLRVWDTGSGEECAVIKLPGFKFHAATFTEVKKRKPQ